MNPDGFKGNILKYIEHIGLRDLETSLCRKDDGGEA